MSTGAAPKPFRFPLFVCVLAVMILACADTETYEPSGPQVYNYATLSRTDGLAYGHFTSKVTVYCSYVNGLTDLHVTGLPAGLKYNSSNNCIEGDDPGPGQWMISVHWSGVNTSTGANESWKQDFELRFFTSLEENR